MKLGGWNCHDNTQLFTTTTDLLHVSILLDMQSLFLLCFLLVLSLEDEILLNSRVLLFFMGSYSV